MEERKKMKNNIIKFISLLISTLVVFSFFVMGIVFQFLPKKDKTTWLYRYVQKVINDPSYDNQYIGEVIVKENIDKIEKVISAFDPNNIRSETSLQSISNIDDSVIWNDKEDIDKPILIDNELSINKSIITNLSFVDPGNKKLTINNSIIIGISIENLHQIEQETIDVDINNSFVYLQSDYLYDFPIEQRPIFKGKVNNSLIGNRLTYAKGVKPYYFNGLNRGDEIKRLSDLVSKDSYYDYYI